jgi:hypothetical protein
MRDPRRFCAACREALERLEWGLADTVRQRANERYLARTGEQNRWETAKKKQEES